MSISNKAFMVGSSCGTIAFGYAASGVQSRHKSIASLSLSALICARTASAQAALGTASNTYTMTGIGTAASRAAQVGPVKLVTAEANGNLATTDFDITGLNSDISRLKTTSIATAGMRIRGLLRPWR
jgi:hypothetical protein